MQRSDSPARNIPGLFLGDPSSGFRIPFDADFRAYRVFGLFLLPVFGLLWLVVPVAGTAALVSWRAGALAGPNLPPVVIKRRGPRLVRRMTRRNLTGALFAAAVFAFLLLLVPSLRFWANPMAWWQALLLAPVIALLLTRMVMPKIGPNTPLAYWMALLPRVAGGPRPRREPATYAPTTFEASDLSLSEIELLALTVDPREVTVITALPKVRPVTAMRWTPSNIEHAAEVIAWVGSHGAGTEVLEANVLRVNKPGGSSYVVVPVGSYLVLADGDFRVFDAKAFAAHFEVTGGGVA